LIGLTVAIALAAAVTFGASTALMHQGASSAPPDASALRGLLGHVLRQRRWLAGFAASVLGLVLHAVALRIGRLAVVQSIVVTGLVLSIVFRAALERHLPPHRMTAWALQAAAGLSVFLTASNAGSGREHVDTPGAAIMLVAGAAAVAGGWAASLHFRGRAGVLLGSAAGVVYGLVAGTLKATTDVALHGIVALATSWPIYVLVALGVTGFLLNQRAYHRAPLSQSVPLSFTLNPIVAVIFGVVAFDERPASQLVATVAEAAGLAGVLIGAFFVARTEAGRA
jgi:hypothetical protein